jgi:hypothetical protein
MTDDIISIAIKFLILIIFISIVIVWLKHLGVPVIAILQSFFAIMCVVIVLLIIGLCVLNKK